MLAPNHTYTLSELLEIAREELTSSQLTSTLSPIELENRLKLWEEVRRTIEVMKTWDAEEGLTPDANETKSSSARA